MKQMTITIAGVVHAIDPIKHASAYARATFNSLDNLVISADGKQLHFQFTNNFVTDSIDSLLASLITDHSNVDWPLTIK